MTATVEAGRRTIEIGNPDKEMFPDEGISKQDLAEYYAHVADLMVPHMEGRALTMHRFPDGIDGDGFYQQRAPDHFPDWIRTAELATEDETTSRVVCDDAATLVYLADQACITPHVWLSRVEDEARPDRMVFDLDPPEGQGAGPVRDAARRVGDVLDDLGLEARLMTTGSKGYHVVVPIVPESGFDEVRAVARAIAEVVAGRWPEDFTVEQRKAARQGRVFVDYLRNSRGQTTVAPYAVRARPGAPIATPIDWDELGEVEPGSYSMGNLFRRLGQRQDPWSGDGIGAQTLDGVADRLEGGVSG